MDLNDDQIKDAIAGEEISAITLDTSIFSENGNRFEHGLLARLKQFNDTNIRVVLSDVVVQEVRSHVISEAIDGQTKVRAGLKSASKAWQFNPERQDDAMRALFGDETPEQHAHRRISAFIESSAVETVESASRVSVARILDDYFSATPPFGKSAAKKSEFPDAFALQGLEHWAKEQDLQLLVVSKDSDWVRYCKTSPHLVATHDLANALSYFHQNAEVACARLIKRFNQDPLPIERAIENAVRDATDHMMFMPEVSSGYFYDADVYDINVASIYIENDLKTRKPFRVIDKPDEDVLVVEAAVEATIEVSSSFDFSVTDPIDKDEVSIGSASATVDVPMDLRVILTFEGDLAGDAELVEVEVETDSRRIAVDYGDVGPDWGPDPGEE
ncbi:TPA: DUF4935 domain-containing protein [Klebsiella pneumoniae]|nr:DUF4935 domain-containing protein [Klebsiella pneumoniae]